MELNEKYMLTVKEALSNYPIMGTMAIEQILSRKHEEIAFAK